MEQRQSLCIDVELAIRMLCDSMPAVGLDKPTLIHSVRVGTRLYNEHYPRAVILGGYLHDLLEDTDIVAPVIAERFGDDVALLVEANTKVKSISNPIECRNELIARCVLTSEAAAIIKAADILDNYIYYSEIESVAGMEYCECNTSTFRRYLPASYSDPIFSELMSVVNRS